MAGVTVRIGMMCTAAAVLAGGCGEKGGAPPARAAEGAAAAPAPTDPALALDRPMTMLADGSESDAVAAFLELRWDDPAADFTLPAARLSEAEFVELSEPERLRLGGEIVDFGGRARKLARAVVDRAKRAAHEGRRADGLALLDALRDFGVRLSDPQKRPELLVHVGMAIVRLADDTRRELGGPP